MEPCNSSHQGVHQLSLCISLAQSKAKASAIAEQANLHHEKCKLIYHGSSHIPKKKSSPSGLELLKREVV